MNTPGIGKRWWEGYWGSRTIRGYRVSPLRNPLVARQEVVVAAAAAATLNLAFPITNLDQFICWTDSRITLARGTAGVSEVQTLSSGNPTSGTISIVYPTYGTVSGLGWNATASAVATAYQAQFGAGNVTGSGGPWPGTPIVLTFVGSLVGVDIPAPTSIGAFPDGSGATVVETVKGAAGTAYDTLTIQPTWPLLWSADYASLWPCPFSADVASMAVTNLLSNRTARVFLEATYGK